VCLLFKQISPEYCHNCFDPLRCAYFDLFDTLQDAPTMESHREPMADFDKTWFEQFHNTFTGQDEIKHRIIRDLQSALFPRSLPGSDREGWFERPRTYAILNHMRHLELMVEFVRSGLRDISIPYNRQQLPPVLHTHPYADDFLRLQLKVLDTSRTIKDSMLPGKPHFHFQRLEDHFKLGEKLGEGRDAAVYPATQAETKPPETSNNHSYSRRRAPSSNGRVKYAIKRIERKPSFESNRKWMKDVQEELEIHGRLRHTHIVELIASYTDLHSVGFVLADVADSDLGGFLRSCKPGDDNTDNIPRLREFYGCLAGAVRYLHEKKVRHRDIKPGNILVKGTKVWLCDFGLAHSWTTTGQSHTHGIYEGTRKYSAPETFKEEVAHNKKSDIWSLGCVFLEMWTIMKGFDLVHMDIHIKGSGSGQLIYSERLDNVTQWVKEREEVGDFKANNLPAQWISKMVREIMTH
jgi:serine/threonine protein kinase